MKHFERPKLNPVSSTIETTVAIRTPMFGFARCFYEKVAVKLLLSVWEGPEIQN